VSEGREKKGRKGKKKVERRRGKALVCVTAPSRLSRGLYCDIDDEERKREGERGKKKKKERKEVLVATCPYLSYHPLSLIRRKKRKKKGEEGDCRSDLVLPLLPALQGSRRSTGEREEEKKGRGRVCGGDRMSRKTLVIYLIADPETTGDRKEKRKKRKKGEVLRAGERGAEARDAATPM